MAARPRPPVQSRIAAPLLDRLGLHRREIRAWAMYDWGKLSADPKAEQCGWLKNKYGLSWQIVPAVMGRRLATTDQRKPHRVTKVFLQMKKFDIAALERAYEGG